MLRIFHSLRFCLTIIGAYYSIAKPSTKRKLDNTRDILVNNISRFQNLSSDNSVFLKNKLILLFISITSGPHHSHLRHAIRNTWILPCKSSQYCDYRFFVDAPQSRMTEELRLESTIHSDMVFRNSCSLMNAHSDLVHYGNSPPVGGNLNATITIRHQHPRMILQQRRKCPTLTTHTEGTIK